MEKACQVESFYIFLFIELPPDIVDFLYANTLPDLEQKLMSYKDLDETQHTENEESYLLSDIFQDINEDQDVEDDDEEEEDND